MDHTQLSIAQRLQKYLREDISEAEMQELQQWRQASTANQALWERLSNEDQFFNDLHDFQSIKLDSKQTLAYVLKHQATTETPSPENEQNIVPIRQFQWKSWLPYIAAVCLLGLLFGGYYYQTQLHETKVVEEVLGNQPLKPRADEDEAGVKITFSDGNAVTLNKDKEAIQMLGDHVYYEDGSGVLSAKAYQYLTVSVPRGEQFQVTLADGSTVFLNAGSTLRYPVAFHKDERRVKLSGEAYFNIKRQESKNHPDGLVPFIVDLGDHQVKVHGTQFNVRDYKQDPDTKITLVEGKVSVHGNAKKLQKGLFLSPGQQAAIHAQHIQVKQADLQQELAWKNGLFSFEGKGLYEVMEELARWYKVDVVYLDKVPDIPFFGMAHRSESLLSILQLLRSADITYRLVSYGEAQPSRLEILKKKKIK